MGPPIIIAPPPLKGNLLLYLALFSIILIVPLVISIYIFIAILPLIATLMGLSPFLGWLSVLLAVITAIVTFIGVFRNVLFTDNSNTNKTANFFLALQLFITFIGFVHTTIWVLNPSNPVHEPRSVFTLAMAAFVAYIRKGGEQREEHSGQPQRGKTRE